MPGVGFALGITLTAVAAAYKMFASGMEEAERPLNEFGLNVDEEMSRLESWAASILEWEGIKQGNANLRADFDLVKGTAEATLTAIQALFNTNVSSKISALQAQASAATASGDAAGAAGINAQIEKEKSYQELVNLNVTLTAAKAELAAQVELAQQAAENYKAIEKAQQEAAASLADLKDRIVARTGNTDATVPGSTEAAALLAKLEERLTSIQGLSEATVAYMERTGSPDAEGFRSLKNDEAPLEKLIEDLRLLKEKSDAAADTEKTLTEAHDKSNESATKSATILSTLGLNVQALGVQLNDAAEAAGPDVAGKAAEQAGLMTRAVADMIERTLQLSVENSNAIIEAGQAGVEGMSSAAGDLDAARIKYKASLESKDVPVAIETFGVEVVGSSEAAAEVIGDGAGLIQGAIEGTAAEAAAAGDEIKKGAEDFRTKIGAAAQDWQAAAAGLVSNARSTMDMVAGLVRDQTAMSRQLAAVQLQASAARADSSLALSQIRNS